MIFDFRIDELQKLLDYSRKNSETELTTILEETIESDMWDQRVLIRRYNDWFGLHWIRMIRTTSV